MSAVQLAWNGKKRWQRRWCTNLGNFYQFFCFVLCVCVYVWALPFPCFPIVQLPERFRYRVRRWLYHLINCPVLHHPSAQTFHTHVHARMEIRLRRPARPEWVCDDETIRSFDALERTHIDAGETVRMVRSPTAPKRRVRWVQIWNCIFLLPQHAIAHIFRTPFSLCVCCLCAQGMWPFLRCFVWRTGFRLELLRGRISRKRRNIGCLSFVLERMIAPPCVCVCMLLLRFRFGFSLHLIFTGIWVSFWLFFTAF